MRVNLGDLKKYERTVAPAPPPIEPLMAPADEARLLANAKSGDPNIALRRERVLVLLRRPATPEGADAELVVLLAAAKALPLERPDDRLAARMRLSEIGRLKDPPPAVRAVQKNLRVKPGDSQAFADALLPPNHDIGGFYESGIGFAGV
jgi:hypothetical protein